MGYFPGHSGHLREYELHFAGENTCFTNEEIMVAPVKELLLLPKGFSQPSLDAVSRHSSQPKACAGEPNLAALAPQPNAVHVPAAQHFTVIVKPRNRVPFLQPLVGVQASHGSIGHSRLSSFCPWHAAVSTRAARFCCASFAENHACFFSCGYAVDRFFSSFCAQCFGCTKN